MSVLSHKIRLQTNPDQDIFFSKACGVARFTYNWAVAKNIEIYRETGRGISAMALKKQFNAIKHEEFPWIKESPKDANQQPFEDVAKAFTNFFRQRAGFPAFKSKHKTRPSFYISNDKLRFEGNIVVLPLIGKVTLAEPLRFTGKILSARVVKELNYWYLAVAVEGDFQKSRIGSDSVGVDLGVATAVTLSDGTKVNAPRGLRKHLKKLKRLGKGLSRKTRGGSNYAKHSKKLAKLHRHISNKRKDFWHKITTKLCRENQTIVIEDLDIIGMIRKSGKKSAFRRAIIDTAMGMFKPMLAYKAALYSCDLIVADKWFPSSKTCSTCNHRIYSMPLSCREWVCPNCNSTHDRDINAAINLRNYRHA